MTLAQIGGRERLAAWSNPTVRQYVMRDKHHALPDHHRLRNPFREYIERTQSICHAMAA